MRLLAPELYGRDVIGIVSPDLLSLYFPASANGWLMLDACVFCKLSTKRRILSILNHSEGHIGVETKTP